MPTETFLPEIPHLLQSLEAGLTDALAHVQRTPGAPDDGAFLHPESGVAETTHIGSGMVIMGLVEMAILGPEARRDEWLAEALRMISYLERVQRPTGRFDLRSCNYDSGPDTAFLVQQMCPTLALLRSAASRAPLAAACAESLERVLRKAAIGLEDGGFHTPNHRWVTASAIAQLVELFPGVSPKLEGVLAALLCEGPDIDAEGCFIERSVAIYDTVCDRSLLMVDAKRGWPAGRAAALANLRFDLNLLHPDGLVETGLSHRQDHGVRTVPAGLAPVLLQAARATADAELASAAAFLWNRSPKHTLIELVWMAHELATGGIPAARPWQPQDIKAFYPINRVWRVRQGEMSLSVFGETTRLVALRYGQAELASLKIGQTYLGHGRFVPRDMEPTATGLRLTSIGQVEAYRLGYSQPLGRQVPKAEWHTAWEQRELRALPRCVTTLDVDLVPGGVDLRIKNVSGLDGVTGQVALDFLPGGVWQTDDCAVKPQPGQVIFLRKGDGEMAYGSHAIRITGGQDAHRMWAMRDFDAPGGMVRIVIGFLTPADMTIGLRCR